MPVETNPHDHGRTHCPETSCTVCMLNRPCATSSLPEFSGQHGRPVYYTEDTSPMLHPIVAFLRHPSLPKKLVDNIISITNSGKHKSNSFITKGKFNSTKKTSKS